MRPGQPGRTVTSRRTRRTRCDGVGAGWPHGTCQPLWTGCAIGASGTHGPGITWVALLAGQSLRPIRAWRSGHPSRSIRPPLSRLSGLASSPDLSWRSRRPGRAVDPVGSR